MKKEVVSLQELATFMRDVAYSDDMENFIDWHLSVIFPKTNDGVVGFSGGIFNRSREMVPESKRKIYDKRVDGYHSVSFSYDEVNGITNFGAWNDHSKIDPEFGGNPTFQEFKEFVKSFFRVGKLYREE